MIYVLLIIGAIIFLIVFIKGKSIRTDSILLINGPVGSGKSSTSLCLAIRKYRLKVIRYYCFKYCFDWILHPFKLLKNPKKRIKKIMSQERPYLYSNIPLYNIKYIPIELNVLKRKDFRFSYNSVLYLCEASLIANSMSYKDNEINEGLTLFVKLVRHEMKGRGLCMVLDTQSPNDLHYSADRSINQSLFIEKSLNLPLFRCVWVREIAINRNNVENVYVDDVKEDDSLRFILIPKSIFKKFDTHCYSILTDDLPRLHDVRYIKSKKLEYKKKKRFFIPSWIKYKEIDTNNDIYLKEKECEENETQEDRKDNS